MSVTIAAGCAASALLMAVGQTLVKAMRALLRNLHANIFLNLSLSASPVRRRPLSNADD